LTKAAERLDDTGTANRRGLLAARDPDGHVHAAWLAKECLRGLYTLAADPDVAAAWLEGLSRTARLPRTRRARSQLAAPDGRVADPDLRG
jgi:hypothetical protein